MGTTAEKFNYAFGTKDLLKTEINKINNVLDANSTFRSYPEELFNGYIDILNNGTDTLWNNLTKVSQADVTEAELSNVVTAPMKIDLKGNTSQETDPTPDDPKDIHVVKGNNVVSVSGKNKFSINEATYVKKYGSSYNINDEEIAVTPTTTWGNVTYSYNVKNNTTYTLKMKITFEGTTQTRWWLSLGNETNEAIYNSGYIDLEGGYLIKTFTTTSEILSISFQGSTTIRPTSVLFSEIQLEEGSTATPYVPYSKTDYPINLGNIELCEINTYKDFPFKAINGNEYYDTLTDEQKNALNYGGWYVHKEIEKVILDGTEKWPRTNAKDNHWRFRTFKYGNIASVQECYSNNFKFNGDTWHYEGINTGKSVIWIRNDELFTTESDLKTWLSTHNTIVYYVLATPTEEQITDTSLISQLEAIFNAKSVADKTYITQTNDDLPFILDVSAIKEYEEV